MKKQLVAFSIVLVLGLSGSLSAQSRFGFKLGEGLSYIGGGDLNQGVAGMVDFYEDLFGLDATASTVGEFRPLHLGANFNAELFFQLSPKIAVGLGTGYFEASRESRLTMTNWVGEVNVWWKPRVAIFPLTLNFRYLIPAGKGFRLVLTAGAGMYFANCRFDWAFQTDVTQMDLSGSGPGIHGGVGLEIDLSPAFALTFDLLGRYAQTGALTGEFSRGVQTAVDGTLWNVEVFYFQLGTYPSLFYSKADISDSPGARQTRLDLSGFGAAVGILIRL